jgi:short-subunit dehydrogenase
MAVDLASERAVPELLDRTSDLEVGLLAYCAGADPNYERFLDQPVANGVAMVNRNCRVPIELCHHFATPMVDRGRGAIVLVGSGAGLVGAPNMAAYAATKAFDMVLGEALWAELQPRGVDVLNLVLAATDTPALRRLLAKRGVLESVEDTTPIPGAESAETVAREAVANLTEGPNYFVGEMMRTGAQQLGSIPRNDAVRLMIELGSGVMGPDPKERRSDQV